MLNILILTYQGTSVRDLSNNETLLQKLVWDDYVARMVGHKGNSQRYPLFEDMLAAWLAGTTDGRSTTRPSFIWNIYNPIG